MVREVLRLPSRTGRGSLTRRLGPVVPLDAADTGTDGVLAIDALFETRTGAGGFGWRLSTPGARGPVRSRTRRHGHSLLELELLALRHGLEEATRAGCTRLTVRVPHARIVPLVLGPIPARYRRAGRVALGLAPCLSRFNSLAVEVRARPDEALHRAVGDALDAGLSAAREEDERRRGAMERVLARARSVVLRQEVDGWVANGRYRVRLEPLGCECPAWSLHWARVPIAGRRAVRLPCKHLVALAMRAGITVPEELAGLARRAPP